MALRNPKSLDATFRGEVGQTEIVGSGSVVSHNGSSVTVYPFLDDPFFGLTVAVKFFEEETEATVKLDLEHIDQKVAKILFTQKYSSGSWFSNKEPLNFAISDDEKTDYSASVAIHVFGPRTAYTMVVHYTVLAVRSN